MPEIKLHLACEGDRPAVVDPVLGYLVVANELFEAGGFYDTFRTYGTRAEATTSWCLKCGAKAILQGVALTPHNSFGIECEPSTHPWFRRVVAIKVPWCYKCEDPQPDSTGCFHVNRLGRITSVQVGIRFEAYFDSKPNVSTPDA